MPCWQHHVDNRLAHVFGQGLQRQSQHRAAGHTGSKLQLRAQPYPAFENERLERGGFRGLVGAYSSRDDDSAAEGAVGAGAWGRRRGWEGVGGSKQNVADC